MFGILNPQQKQKFYVFKQKRDADIEFFELKEGLILDQEQTVKIEKILKDFREKAKKDMKKRGGRIGMGMPGRSGGMRGGSMGGGGMMPGMGGGRGGMRGGGMGGPGMGRGGQNPNNQMMKKMHP